MMEQKFADFYEAWWYLTNHPQFEDYFGGSDFNNLLGIDVVKVNPLTEEVDDDPESNVATRVWLESNYMDKNLSEEIDVVTHDIDLDCGAPTFEEAIIKLANLHYNKYSQTN